MNRSSATKPSNHEPWLAFFIVSTGGIVALAVVLTVIHSLGGLDWPPALGLNLHHWRAVLHGDVFWTAFGYSTLLTMATLLIALASALLIVLVLGERVRYGLLGRVLYLPLAVPGTVAALLAYQFLSNAGLLSRLAHVLGWAREPADFPALIFDPAGIGVVLTHVAMITPLFIVLLDNLRQHERLPLYLQQAESLGASRTQALRHIALPLLARGALPVIGVYGVALLGAFEVPLLIGAAYPSMLSIEIQRQINGLDQTLRPQGYAMATLYLLLLIAAWALIVWRGARPKLSA